MITPKNIYGNVIGVPKNSNNQEHHKFCLWIDYDWNVPNVAAETSRHHLRSTQNHRWIRGRRRPSKTLGRRGQFCRSARSVEGEAPGRTGTAAWPSGEWWVDGSAFWNRVQESEGVCIYIYIHICTNMSLNVISRIWVSSIWFHSYPVMRGLTWSTMAYLFCALVVLMQFIKGRVPQADVRRYYTSHG